MKKTGFTLMELVVTVSIVIVLSLISGPLYNSYSTNAKFAEGYALLGALRTAQERYYSDYGTFLCCNQSSGGLGSYPYSTCNDTVLGIDARTNLYYTSFIVNSNSSGLDVQDFSFRASVMSKSLKRLNLAYNRTSGITLS